MRYDFNPTEENIKQTAEAVVFSGSFEDTPDIAALEIGEGVLEIAEYAFRDFENIQTVKLPKSLKKISASAFSATVTSEEASKAQSVRIPTPPSSRSLPAAIPQASPSVPPVFPSCPPISSQITRTKSTS